MNLSFLAMGMGESKARTSHDDPGAISATT